jgi:hypothetical protein
MDYPNNKKQRINDADATLAEAAADLSTDLLANILGCLDVKDIMRSRGVNKKWKEAVKMTIVPLSADFAVMGLRKYNAMNVMTTEVPNLQQITLRGLGGLGRANKWSDGEDPDESHPHRTADFSSHDIEIISNFRKLRYLKIEGADLNGRYPFLFNSFPRLQKLTTRYCNYLKFDLEMLAGLPLLKELDCWENRYLAGNISSLRVLKDTLEKVKMDCCSRVQGNFMDLADFPHLKALNLYGTAVIGDIRDIGENDFSSLEHLKLPQSVLGVRGCEFQRISDGTELVRAVYLLRKKFPALEIKYWYGRLSRDSPDRYESMSRNYPPAPFTIRLVEVGSRFGYRWASHDFDSHIPCAVNWLDPEPDGESSDYEEYIAKLEEMNTYEVQFYRGFHQPPTEEEYRRLIDALAEESDSEESSDE